MDPSAPSPTEPKRRPGRPSGFNEEVFNEVMMRLADGETIRRICNSDPTRLPSRHTLYNWIQADKELFSRYMRARSMQADGWADDIIEIADDKSEDVETVETSNGSFERPNREFIERSKVRIDSRKWIMARNHPQRWGDRVEQVVSGGEKAVSFTLQIGDPHRHTGSKTDEPIDIEAMRAPAPTLNLGRPAEAVKVAEQIIGECL